MARTLTQIIVDYFIDFHNVKFSGNQYKLQLGQAKILLKDYSAEDIILVMGYTSRFPKTRINSLAYFRYIMDDTLPKAKKWQHDEELRKVNEWTAEQFEKKENKSLSKKKLLKTGNF